MEELIESYSRVPATQRYALVGLIITALCALHYYLIYDSQQSQLEALKTQVSKRQGVRNEKENIAQNKSTYEAKLGRLQQQLDEARAKLPDSADVPQLLAQLGGRARETGLAIEQFQPTQEAIKGFVAEIGFKMKGHGSFHEVALFIDSVSKLDRIINVQNLELTNPKTENSRVIVAASFDVKTYRFVPESEIPPAPAKGKKK